MDWILSLVGVSLVLYHLTTHLLAAGLSAITYRTKCTVYCCSGHRFGLTHCPHGKHHGHHRRCRPSDPCYRQPHTPPFTVVVGP